MFTLLLLLLVCFLYFVWSSLSWHLTTGSTATLWGRTHCRMPTVPRKSQEPVAPLTQQHRRATSQKKQQEQEKLRRRHLEVFVIPPIWTYLSPYYIYIYLYILQHDIFVCCTEYCQCFELYLECPLAWLQYFTIFFRGLFCCEATSNTTQQFHTKWPVLLQELIFIIHVRSKVVADAVGEKYLAWKFMKIPGPFSTHCGIPACLADMFHLRHFCRVVIDSCWSCGPGIPWATALQQFHKDQSTSRK